MFICLKNSPKNVWNSDETQIDSFITFFIVFPFLITKSDDSTIKISKMKHFPLHSSPVIVPDVLRKQT